MVKVARGLLVVAVCAFLACVGRDPLDHNVPTTDDQAARTAVGRTMAELQQEVMDRWNAAAEARPPAGYDFHWLQAGQFPHPTFKMGTSQAYHEFAFVLLVFLDQEDTLDFLVTNHFLRAPLHYFFSGSTMQDGLTAVTFETLTNQFSTPGTHGDVPPDVQARLKAYADRMRAAP